MRSQFYLKCLFLIVLMQSATASGQTSFFWNQYSAFNPAATGVSTNFDVASTTYFRKNGVTGELLSADVRVKKVHGAFGAGYSYRHASYATFANPYLNYSFHMKTGENSLLAIGTSASFSDVRFKTSNDYYPSSSIGLGAHYQYKEFKVGVAFNTYDAGKSTKIEWSDIYVDYTKRFNDNWGVHAAFHAGGNYRGNNDGFMARVIYKDRFWLGANCNLEGGYGMMAGVNLNDKWSLGYSFNTSFNPGTPTHSVMLRFKIPGN